ncbi:MAG: site-specific integrase [Chloroflexota bacterium]|nr:site-specific integrase [Chloroflexota bacterium]
MRGSIEKRTGPQGPTYRVRVEYPPDPVTGKRRQRSKSFRTRKEAQAALAQWGAEIARGTALEPSRATVGDLLGQWLASVAAHNVKAATLEDYEATVRVHVLPELGSVPVQRLTAARVQSFYAAKLAAGASPRTVQLCHLRLSQALKQGVAWGLVPHNACASVRAPRVTYKRFETWNPDEARAFLAAAEGDALSPLWLLALSTGMRRGELLGLRWRDVDLDAGTLSVRQCLIPSKGGPVLAEPKTAAARRLVRLPAEAIAALREHRRRQVERRLALGSLWRDLDLVLCTGEGNVVNPANVDRSFARLVRAAGVRRIRFHDLRHTHATWLLAAGQPVKVVSERLGHARVSITLDTYAHVLPDMQEAAAEAIGSLLSIRAKSAAPTRPTG